MRNENVYFVDFGFEHITMLVAVIENNHLIDIPLILEKKVKIPLQRHQSVIERMENFETLVLLINEAEKMLKTNINSIILVIKSNAMNAFFTQCKMDFKKKQKISQFHEEQLATTAIKEFYKKTNNNYNMLDFINNGFVIDQFNCVKNPCKITCKSLSFKATIIGIKNIFATQFSSYLEKFKIHTQHYISSCVAVSNLSIELIPEYGNFLFIDFGSHSTEFCITQNHCITYLNSINLGGIDITRDIAKEIKISVNDADEIKKQISNTDISKNNDQKSKLTFEQIEKIANARLQEIIMYIKKTIQKNRNDIFFKKIYIFGGASVFKNTEKIVNSVFNTSVEVLNMSFVNSNKTLLNIIQQRNLKINNFQLLVAVIFYLKNLNTHKNARRGFLFKIPTKISCFLKDLLY